MNLQQASRRWEWARVIATGEEFRVTKIDFQNNLIFGNNYDTLGWRTGYNLSDVQELTPLSFCGMRIGIGDTIADTDGRTGTVFNYLITDEEKRVCFSGEDNINSDFCIAQEPWIQFLSPLANIKKPEVKTKLERILEIIEE